jgi:hypothetical protein
MPQVARPRSYERFAMNAALQCNYSKKRAFPNVDKGHWLSPLQSIRDEMSYISRELAYAHGPVRALRPIFRD